MSQFQVFRSHIETAISACLASATEYRNTNGVIEVPLNVIQGLVAQHITPLGGMANSLNIPVIDKKTDWRRHATEVVFRRTLLNIAMGVQNEELYKQTMDCLDIILYCSEPGVELLDNVTFINLIEELMEVHTTTGCEKIFDYVEKRKNRITVDLVPGRGKGLVLLRMCNELLRRLSKETNTVFCGRILMFLANTFPLAERSGVNLRGDFNTDMISFDSDEEVDADTSLTDDQKKFYKTFWSTRVYFSNPPSIFIDDNFEKLQQGTNSIAQRFQIIAQKEAEILGARKSDVNPLKRAKTDSTMDLEEDPVLTEQLLNEINREFQFLRLLSSRKLLDLEMEDSRFRRNVILQYLVLFQYLSGFSQQEKDKTASLLAARGTTKQSLIQPNYVLTDEQVKWIDETRELLLTLLRSTKPHGNFYTEIILTMLENERHWIIWKASGCPTFEKPPISITDLERTWLSKKPRLSAPPTKYRFTHGNSEVSKLYGKPSAPLSEFMLNRPKIPTPIEVIDTAIADLDDNLDPSKDRFAQANGALLQASRLMYREHASLIRPVYSTKKEIYKKMHEELNADKDPASLSSTDENKKPATPGVADFIVGEEITEDHVRAEIEVLTKARKIIIDETSIKIDDDAMQTE